MTVFKFHYYVPTFQHMTDEEFEVAKPGSHLGQNVNYSKKCKQAWSPITHATDILLGYQDQHESRVTNHLNQRHKVDI